MSTAAAYDTISRGKMIYKEPKRFY